MIYSSFITWTISLLTIAFAIIIWNDIPPQSICVQWTFNLIFWKQGGEAMGKSSVLCGSFKNNFHSVENEGKRKT